MASNHTKLTRDLIGGSLQINNKYVIDRHGNLCAQNATLRGDVRITGNLVVQGTNVLDGLGSVPIPTSGLFSVLIPFNFSSKGDGVTLIPTNHVTGDLDNAILAKPESSNSTFDNVWWTGPTGMAQTRLKFDDTPNSLYVGTYNIATGDTTLFEVSDDISEFSGSIDGDLLGGDSAWAYDKETEEWYGIYISQTTSDHRIVKFVEPGSNTVFGVTGGPSGTHWPSGLVIVGNRLISSHSDRLNGGIYFIVWDKATGSALSPVTLWDGGPATRTGNELRRYGSDNSLRDCLSMTYDELTGRIYFLMTASDSSGPQYIAWAMAADVIANPTTFGVTLLKHECRDTYTLKIVWVN